MCQEIRIEYPNWESCERETVIQIDDESGEYSVYSSRRKDITKLLKMPSLKREIVWIDESNERILAIKGKLPATAFTFRRI